MNKIFTEIRSWIKPDSGRKVVQISAQLELFKTAFDMEYFNKLTDAMVEKSVKEIWKIHGPSILKKVDKKTIGNLTVKKLSTLIAKELKM